MPDDLSINEKYQETGMTMKDVADHFGISVGYVHKVLHRFGSYIKPKPYAQLCTKEAQIKSGKTRTGRKFSAEHRLKLSEAKKLLASGHRKPRKDGYISVYYPKHPAATKDGYVMEHRLLMEQHIGRYLLKDEVVHHINHKRNDNRLENLKLMTFREHAALHMRERYAQRRER